MSKTIEVQDNLEIGSPVFYGGYEAFITAIDGNFATIRVFPFKVIDDKKIRFDEMGKPYEIIIRHHPTSRARLSELRAITYHSHKEVVS
ncbi:MAG: hypothetical protein KGJ13_02025 [Patescibacteria group bacterium]|nr:hypothetical protein [Patescibacteria group bacterium]